MTGYELAKSICPHVYLADRDYYDWNRQAVFLRRSVAEGSGPFHLLVASHECAHHEQNLRWPTAKRFLWFVPLLIVIEVHAWLRAIVRLSA